MKKYFVVLACAFMVIFQLGGSHIVANAKGNDVWEDVLPSILAEIEKPFFPDRDFNVVDYGAVNDGSKKATKAFNEAISAANDAGGGKVVVPSGTYLTGAIHLKSNVNLHLEEGATIKFSQNPKDYLPLVKSRWEGVELYNYSPLIYAHNQENIAITGKGVLDGQADNEHWWPWKGKTEYGWKKGDPNQAEARDELFQMAEDGVAVEDRKFGEGSYLRPSFIQPYESENILIEGVTLIDSPMWFINPVLSENVTIEDVTVVGHGPNNDGVDPESSKNVLIKDSHFDTGDDCIAIKSGRNADGRRINVPSENIVIQANEMRDGHGGVVVGSEMTGGVRNVFAENNVMNSPNLDRVLRIKTNSVRGGFAENIYLRDNLVDEVGGEVIRVNMQYEEGDVGEYTPVIRNIEVDNLHSNGGNYGIYIRAYDRAPVQNLKITNSSFDGVKTPTLIENVENMQLSNLTINGENYDNSPPKTTAQVNGQLLSDGSYFGKATVALVASDKDGIDNIKYQLQDSGWKAYTAPITVKKNGKNFVHYYAVDRTGNRESQQTLQVRITNADFSGVKGYISGADIHPGGIKNALTKKLENAEADFKKGKVQSGNKKLRNLIQFVQHKKKTQIPQRVKTDLTNMIRHLIK